MEKKQKEMKEWVAGLEAGVEVPKLSRSEVSAFHFNRNSPFTWDMAWSYVVSRVRGLKPIQTRKYMDAQFSPRRTGEDFLEFGLLFNNPQIIQSAMYSDEFHRQLHQYFEQVTITVTSFEDNSKTNDPAKPYKYYMAVLLTFE